MKKPILVVMAAGIGSRFGGLKQMTPFGVNGESLIDYSLYDALQVGFERVVFIVNKRIKDDFQKIVGKCILFSAVTLRRMNLPWLLFY